jgi:subtilisin family serine protease
LVNGSSFAAAHVSGLFALLRERAPRASTGSALVTVRPGGGAIDACASLIKTSGPCDCACAHARSPTAVSAR